MLSGTRLVFLGLAPTPNRERLLDIRLELEEESALLCVAGANLDISDKCPLVPAVDNYGKKSMKEKLN